MRGAQQIKSFTLLLLGFIMIVQIQGWINDQAASFVIGQRNFYTNTAAAPASNTFTTPYSICISPVTDKVFVVSEGDNRILRFHNRAEFVCSGLAEAVLGQPNFGSTISGAAYLSAPLGCAIGANDWLWVADSGNNRVLGWRHASTIASGTAPTKVLGQIGFTQTSANRGNADNEVDQFGMNNPVDLAYNDDDTDSLFVADALNCRILRYNKLWSLPNGSAATAVLGQPSFFTVLTNFNQSVIGYPTGLHLSKASNTLFVSAGIVTSQRGRVLRFDNVLQKSGLVAANALFGATSYTDSTLAVTNKQQVCMPRGVTVDDFGNLLVADATAPTSPFFGNNRILVYENAFGAGVIAPNALYVLGQPNFTTHFANQGSSVPSAYSLDNPRLIHYDHIGLALYVADSTNNRIVVYASNPNMVNRCYKCPPLGTFQYYVWDVPDDEDPCDEVDKRTTEKEN